MSKKGFSMHRFGHYFVNLVIFAHSVLILPYTGLITFFTKLRLYKHLSKYNIKKYKCSNLDVKSKSELYRKNIHVIYALSLSL